MNRFRYLRIRLTNRCNLQCTWCHGEGGTAHRVPQELSPQQIAEATTLLVRCGFYKIKLTGGEPTMRSDLEAIILLLRQIPRTRLSMVTNGTLLTREKLRRYRRAGLPRINVSINTLNSSRYLALQGGNASLLQRALDSIPQMIATGYERPKINFIYRGSESDADLDSVVRFARKHSVKVTILNTLPNPIPSAKSHGNIPISDVIDKVASLGVRRVYIDDDPHSFATLCFELDCGVILEVLHHQVGQVGVYSSCATCMMRADCREGIFAQRLTPGGFLQPCLLRADNWCDLRPYLSGEIDEQAAVDLVTTFLGNL